MYLQMLQKLGAAHGRRSCRNAGRLSGNSRVVLKRIQELRGFIVGLSTHETVIHDTVFNLIKVRLDTGECKSCVLEYAYL